MTAYERSGWRDQELSARHRVWGFNCPAVDLDFLMVEYDGGYPIALVEYKHHEAGIPLVNHPTYRAISQLYDDQGKQLPLWVARYWPNIWAFRVLAVNSRAKDLTAQPDSWNDMTERMFVEALHAVRRREIQHRVYPHLNDILPPTEDEEVA